MNNVVVLDRETFNEKRPGYKEGNDHSMTVTYVTSDWTKQPKTKPEQKPTKPEPVQKNVPQPKPEVKPEAVPSTAGGERRYTFDRGGTASGRGGSAEA